MTDWPELPFIDTVMTTIVFYGFDHKLPIREARALIEKLCMLLGETPSHAHVGLDEESRKSRAPKFDALEKPITRGDFDDYYYLEGVNYFQKGNVRDCSLAVGINYASYGKDLTIHFKSIRSEPVDRCAMLAEVLKFLSPAYGIEYGLTVREGPRWFVTGLWSSGMPDSLGQASSEFHQEFLFGKRFKDGFFRDVFRWNYLSRAHLDKMIEGMRFEDWIEEPLKKKAWLGRSKTRGKLSMLENGCTVWELNSDEVVEVRPRMLQAGLLMVRH